MDKRSNSFPLYYDTQMKPNTLKALPTLRTQISEIVIFLNDLLVHKYYCFRSHAGLCRYKDEKYPISTTNEAYSLEIKQRNISTITIQYKFNDGSKFSIL